MALSSRGRSSCASNVMMVCNPLADRQRLSRLRRTDTWGEVDGPEEVRRGSEAADLRPGVEGISVGFVKELQCLVVDNGTMAVRSMVVAHVALYAPAG
mmetsp:Transcript_52529/g.132037  ORF Transcript_52529/g.132037 Transcript_52529/m.132037 type:complete len:98 (+) Transcript_52529:138-431(+)